MSDCPNCKPTILNKQSFIIGAPKCDECGELEVECSGEYIYTECVKSNVVLSCIDTEIGATQTEINQAFDEKLCDVSSGCIVSVDANDTCCGYLSDKIDVGDGLTKEIVISGDNCKKIVISETCWEFTDVVKGTGDGKFKGKWDNSVWEPVGYSDVKECIVRLKGTALNSSYNGTSDKTIFTLPTGRRPALTRRYSVNISNGLSLVPASFGFIYVYNTGNVVLEYTQFTAGTTIVSLDGISFEID